MVNMVIHECAVQTVRLFEKNTPSHSTSRTPSTKYFFALIKKLFQYSRRTCYKILQTTTTATIKIYISRRIFLFFFASFTSRVTWQYWTIPVIFKLYFFFLCTYLTKKESGNETNNLTPPPNTIKWNRLKNLFLVVRPLRGGGGKGMATKKKYFFCSFPEEFLTIPRKSCVF